MVNLSGLTWPLTAWLRSRLAVDVVVFCEAVVETVRVALTEVIALGGLAMASVSKVSSWTG